MTTTKATSIRSRELNDAAATAWARTGRCAEIRLLRRAFAEELRMGKCWVERYGRVGLAIAVVEQNLGRGAGGRNSPT